MKIPASGRACRIGGGLLVGVLVASAGAQTLPPSSATPSSPFTTQGAATLGQAVEAAWQRAEQAREAEGQARSARAERVAASSLWAAAPAVELSHQDDRLHSSAGRRETEAGLVWPLWLPGQRDARSASAGAELNVALAAAQAGRLHFAGLVRELAWSLAALRAEVDLADVQVRFLQTVADDVDRRVKAGDLARADALAARSEVLASRAVQVAALQRLQAGRSQWRVLTGLEVMPGPLNEMSSTPANLTFDPSSHPDARLATLTVERARKRLDVVAVSRRDPPELLLRIRQEVPGRREASQNSVGVGIRIPFGTESRNQPLQAAALSELEIAQTAADRLNERLTTDVAMARAAAVAAEQQLETEQSRAGLLRERAVLLEKSFKAGETPLPELLRALAASAQAENGSARQRVAVGLANTRIQQALGILP